MTTSPSKPGLIYLVITEEAVLTEERLERLGRDCWLLISAMATPTSNGMRFHYIFRAFNGVPT